MSDEMKSGFDAVNARVDGLGDEVGELRTEVRSLSERMDAGFARMEAKLDRQFHALADMISGVAGFAARTDEKLDRVIHHVVGMDGRLRELDGYVKKELVTRDEYHERMDAFTKAVRDRPS